MSEQNESAAVETDPQGDALREAIEQALTKHAPGDIKLDTLLARFALVAISTPPTRTNIVAQLTWAAASAFAASLTKDQLLALVNEVYDATTKHDKLKEMNKAYLQKNAEAKLQAAAAKGAVMVPGDGHVH